MTRVNAPEDLVHALSSEVALLCTADATITWADARAEHVLNARPGMDFGELAVPGGAEKARRLVQSARLAKTDTWELVVMANGRPLVMVWRGAPAPARTLGVDLVGQHLETGYASAFESRRLDGSPLAARDQPLQRAARNGEITYGEQFLVRHAQDRRMVPLLVNSAPLFAPTGELAGAVAVFQDITPIKDLEREKDEFLAAVAHDLKNPLVGVKGWTQLLRRRVRKLPADDQAGWQRDLDAVKTSAERMGAILDQLIDLTHLQMGRPLELHRANTDLVALVERVVAEQQHASPRHAIRIQRDAVMLDGFWDTTRLERVVANLLSNAVKYSPEGGVVEIAIAGEGELAVLRVRDSGIGIPADDLPHLFERFYRASNATRFVGTGIGLAGARQLVEQHGGTIEVESTLGVGSVFEVRLPIGGPAEETS